MGCSNNEEKPVFVTKRFSEHLLDRIGHKSWSYYCPCNFIIDRNGDLYLHTKDSILILDTGNDSYFPIWLNLNIEDINKIGIDTFKLIVDDISSKKGQDIQCIQIATKNDTILSTIPHEMIDYLERKNFKNYHLRNTTEEETVVLDTLKAGGVYNFYKVKWKSRFASETFPPPPNY